MWVGRRVRPTPRLIPWHTTADNVKESQIYTDARLLQKLVKKIYEEHKTPGSAAEKTGSASPEPEAAASVLAPAPAAKPDFEMKPVMDGEEDDEDEDDPMGEAAAVEAQSRRRVSSSQPASTSGGAGAATGDRRGPRGPYQRHGPSVYKLTKMGSMLLDRAKTPEWVVSPRERGLGLTYRVSS